ncbi:MAG: acetylornithine/succinylornithine family transaminase [Planctomycetota bacterium]
MTADAPTITDPTQDPTIARHDAHLSPNYPRFPITVARGSGSELWDANGKRYIDLFAGFGAPILGHCHPELVAAVTEQANTLWHVGNLYHTDPQTRAAQAISQASGFDAKVFFCHAGADANEAAIKLARLYGKQHPRNSTSEHGRFELISCTQSFHGRSFATMGATGNPAVREGFGPHLPGTTNVPYNNLDAVKAALTDQTIAIIAEPIQGEGGVHVPDPDYFQQLRALCDEHDLLLIADEVWTGCGRTGQWFGYQHWGITPDLFTLGKGVGGGLAVGAMAAHPRLTELVDPAVVGSVKHATTLGGNCLSMAVTAKIFEVIQRNDLLTRATELQQHITAKLTPLLGDDNPIKEIRGRGLFLGLELHEPLVAGDVMKHALTQGLMLNATSGNVLRLAPPLTIETALLDEGLDLLAQCLTQPTAAS